MILKEIIRERRSAKSFILDKAIAQDKLSEIFESATLAPSGFNLQPWRFITVQSLSNKEKLYSCAFKQEQIRQASAVLICCGDRHVFSPEYIESVLELGKSSGSMNEKHADFLRGAIPTFAKFHPSYDSIEAWTNRQVMIAVTQMMLTAKSIGIDSCSMEGFVSKAIKENFDIPEHWDICCLLALGYSANERKFGGRFGVKELFYQESYPQ
ncbi:nitroreductase family protein [Waterburya agarophytonicola K14]|uniref:Nitroreductase family protein n=1 Tax=Waterburya agarophytonicola KI4 TaxID=2874699 RepID=A0A964BM11_9CYAN|nr:nitroreductase family protein [Waterburya agarophytonicola]MCC0175860.1 nitroreductase family protein [Waterburya agarophytonicola KI4]